jgi:hypothetical protein
MNKRINEFLKDEFAPTTTFVLITILGYLLGRSQAGIECGIIGWLVVKCLKGVVCA